MPSSLLPFRRLFILAAVGCTGLILQACQGPQEPLAADTRLEGPMPAFRSVLDGRPRMLTVRLDDDVRVAYDTDSGHLYKAWEGDLELKGAPFDQRHGPQPRSEGGSYLINESAVWSVQGQPDARVRYSGYRIEGDQVFVLYRVNGQGW